MKKSAILFSGRLSTVAIPQISLNTLQFGILAVFWSDDIKTLVSIFSPLFLFSLISIYNLVSDTDNVSYMVIRIKHARYFTLHVPV